jgi:ubiquinone/menaquinone biosynthesis C-methylase UbiE
MGHDDRERRRLVLQASIINPITGQLLRRAGILPGMRVLDIGCGVGEVSVLAARLVGPHGRVTGLDIDESSLASAREKAQQELLTQVDFVHANVNDYHPEQPPDAIIGRHILIHTPDPAALLRSVFGMLAPGGLAVFQEYDFGVVPSSYPASPLRERAFAIFRDFFGRATQGRAGSMLFHLFLQAGFPAPDCRAEYSISGGPDSPYYEWFAESLRSILPRAKDLGLVEDDIDIDTLADRLRAESVSLQSSFPAPVMIGCFARKS